MKLIAFVELIIGWGRFISWTLIVSSPFVLVFGVLRKNVRATLLYSTLSGLMLLGGLIGVSTYSSVVAALEPVLAGPVGKRLDVRFADVVSGAQGSLDTWSGKVVLLQFRASWNEDANHPMQDLEQVLAELGGTDLAVLTLWDEPRDVLLARPPPPPAVVRGTFELESMPELLRGHAVQRPVSVLIDRKGVVRDVFVGERDAAFLVRELREYL
ncbi:hypothetical protein [Vitiosangium sp. GDMCC 1.1324]|uniref:TlpA family protein disulfide reductase n=1 Tax=Vitiosangium sp. (strain GDMCC 1.1324) TaxID=2138576 RepID=UPI000D34370F|nr:hypothetical protein [Vitiosangium sp. GDMCC 1.1324]PTL84699.1 hypothetical protein DAT35_06430 [Vitiosangium sp. GDMCC 1.1324]